jgi:predicted Zn-dependent protease
MSAVAILERAYFESLRDKAFASRRSGEHLFLNLSAEQSQFVRLNAARVRQIGTVEDADLEVTLVLESPDGALRTASASTTLTGLSYVDHDRVAGLLADLRREVPELPADPYAQLPKDTGSSERVRSGKLLGVEDAADALVSEARGADVAGIYAAGTIARAMANTAGQTHWFSTRNFSLDYSLYTPAQRALKGTFAGADWDAGAYRAEMEASRSKLALLERPARKVERGTYRAFLEPAAYADLIQMLSWGGVSEASIRQGDSPLRLMRVSSATEGLGSSSGSGSGSGGEVGIGGGTGAGETRGFSPIFALSEDFTEGQVPSFNAEGELAPERLALIDRGRLASTLVSSRTGLEYGTPANGADESEAMRAPSLAGGGMARADALKRLGTGLYLSNLHYLNWSDQPGGRITGMTRYACFWVDGGEIVAPIENLRFDDSIFSLFGTALEDLTRETAYLPDVGSYGGRELGGIRCPGALLKGMEFTL